MEKEIVSELDPRLGSDLSETSVYRDVGKFFEELAIAEEESATKVQKEPEKPPSEQSSEEESWYKTDVSLPTGGVRDLKVSIQGSGAAKGQDDPSAQNYPPAFPPQNYPPAMPFVPVIPQTIQQVPRPKDDQHDREPVKEADIPVQPKAADVPKPAVPTSLPLPQPIHAEEAKTQEEPPKQPESSNKSKEGQKQDSVNSGEEKEKKKAYGKRRGHKTVIPEDKVNSWIAASEPFFSQDISPEPLPEPVMPLLVPKPVITQTLPSSGKTETGSTSSDKRKRSKSPEKSSSTEKTSQVIVVSSIQVIYIIQGKRKGVQRKE